MKSYPLLFQTVFKERIWGGSRLAEWFPECPVDAPIGEAWVLSDHPEGRTPVENGPYKGKSLRDIGQASPEWFRGTPFDRFPVLIKVIDASADLSIQVHPDDEYGLAHAGEQGKTECWWVLDAPPEGARLIYGHTAKTREEFQGKVERGEWSSLLQTVEPKPGDFYFVPAGKLHALCEGTMVLEIQQSSDTTYRVYDYDRIDAKGQKRPLHLEDALAVTHYPDEPVEDIRHPFTRGGITGEQLVACPYFTVELWRTQSAAVFSPRDVVILSVIAGSGTLDSGEFHVKLQPGSQVLLPIGVGEVSLSGSIHLIATTVPMAESLR